MEKKAYSTLLLSLSQKKKDQRPSFNQDEEIVETLAVSSHTLERRNARGKLNMSRRLSRAKLEHTQL